MKHFSITRSLVCCSLLAALVSISTLTVAEDKTAESKAAEPKTHRERLHPSVISKGKVYQPVGAPADPKVNARWNFFRDYNQATKLLKEIAAAHPDICRLESLGKSYGKREMWVLTITNFKTLKKDKELERPAFWIDGGIHANELQAVDTVLYTAWFLSETNNRNKMVTKLLNERVIYLLPMMSPDSRDAHMYQPNTTHSPRTGQRPMDDDRDGRVDEDGYDDIDKDGHITQMRIKDPNGRYKPHPDYPKMLVRCKPNEKGSYTMLGQEGIDNDGDGRVNEDGDGVYDPNRDWAWGWQPGYVQRGAYKYPFSLEENRMAADFIMAHPNIAGAQSYHNTGGMLLRGPGVKSDRWPRSDIAIYDILGERGEAMLPGYHYIVTGEDLYEVYGGEHDWFYGMLGVFAFTNELNTPFNLFRTMESANGHRTKPDAMHKFDEYLLMGDGFVDWHEVDHPQYGKIEVGGFKKSWSRQPPSFLLEEECHRNMAFTIFHADSMPQVQVNDIQVKSVGNGLKEVTAIVMNPKLIPTRAAIDVQRKLFSPDRVAISGKDLKVISTLSSSNLFFERATVHKRDLDNIRVSSLKSNEPMYVRWLVKGDGPFTVTVRSVKGGVASKSTETKAPSKDSGTSR